MPHLLGGRVQVFTLHKNQCSQLQEYATRSHCYERRLIQQSTQGAGIPYEPVHSHARRKFTDIVKLFPAEVEYVVQCYAQIWKHDAATMEQGLSPEVRRDYHQSHSLPVMEEIKSWSEGQLETQSVEENSSLGRAIQYFLKHYEGLTAFCRIPGAKLDNNLQEMVLKLIARGRKNAHFFKTHTGAIVEDVVTSLISTCELNRINVFEYLVALQQHRQSVGRHPEKWLPWNYLQTANTVAEVING